MIAVVTFNGTAGCETPGGSSVLFQRCQDPSAIAVSQHQKHFLDRNLHNDKVRWALPTWVLLLAG